MSADKKELSKEIVVKILDNEYTIHFPTTGQLIRIQTSKIRMADGTYQDLLMSSSDSLFVRFLIDAIASFQVLIPKLFEHLTKDIFEMDLMQTKPIVKVYTDVYLPWYNDWTKLIQGEDTDE